MKISLILLAGISIAGCATTKVSDADRSTFKEAITAGDSKAALSVVEDQSTLTEVDAYRLSEAALHGGCHDAVMAAIIDRAPTRFSDSDGSFVGNSALGGLRKGETVPHAGALILNLLAASACPASIKALLPHLSHDEVAMAVTARHQATFGGDSGRWSIYPVAFKGTIDSIDHGVVAANIDDAAATFRLLRAAVKDYCGDDGAESASCRADKVLDGLSAYAVAHAAAAKERESPQGIQRAACAVARDQARLKGYLGQENRVAEVSGAVNLTEKHSLGVGIVMDQEKLDALAAVYQKKAGKPLDLKDCAQAH